MTQFPARHPRSMSCKLTGKRHLPAGPGSTGVASDPEQCETSAAHRLATFENWQRSRKPERRHALAYRAWSADSLVLLLRHQLKGWRA